MSEKDFELLNQMLNLLKSSWIFLELLNANIPELDAKNMISVLEIHHNEEAIFELPNMMKEYSHFEAAIKERIPKLKIIYL